MLRLSRRVGRTQCRRCLMREVPCRATIPGPFAHVYFNAYWRGVESRRRDVNGAVTLVRAAVIKYD